jgi:hypothetical protein
MKKFTLGLVFAIVLFSGVKNIGYATGDVYLTVKNNGVTIYSGTIPLSPTSSEDNVLSVIKQADTLSPDFNISNIIHYSFGDYLKCITISGTTELCDNWLYKVNGDSPIVGMDSYVLSGGENIVLYFGSDIAPTDGAYGAGPLVSNPPPAPDWLVPKEAPSAPVAPSIPIIPIIPTIPDNSSLSSQSQAAVPATKYVEIEENKPKPKMADRTPKKLIKKQNLTTAAINANQNPPVITKTTPPEKGWFRNLLDKIFSVF